MVVKRIETIRLIASRYPVSSKQNVHSTNSHTQHISLYETHTHTKKYSKQVTRLISDAALVSFSRLGLSLFTVR